MSAAVGGQRGTFSVPLGTEVTYVGIWDIWVPGFCKPSSTMQRDQCSIHSPWKAHELICCMNVLTPLLTSSDEYLNCAATFLASLSNAILKGREVGRGSAKTGVFGQTAGESTPAPWRNGLRNMKPMCIGEGRKT